MLHSDGLFAKFLPEIGLKFKTLFIYLRLQTSKTTFLAISLFMLANIHTPIKLSATELDGFLERAWFRLGQSLFTTNFLKFNQEIYSAFWLRIHLENFQMSKSQLKLIQQNRHFDVKIEDAYISDEMEELFVAYKSIRPFETAESLVRLLYQTEQKSIFKTKVILLFDQAKLIGLGFFDLGQETVEGIVTAFHPDYKKYSLGKYLMLQKMLFAKENGFLFFYPGYIAPDYKIFAYKQDLAKGFTEYFDIFTANWKPIEQLRPERFPINLIKEKLTELSECLLDKRIPHEIQFYTYFDVNLFKQFKNQNLLQQPVILSCFSVNFQDIGIVIFDFLNDVYQLWICKPAFEVNSPVEQPNFFTSHILQPKVLVLASPQKEAMIEKLIQIFDNGVI